MVVPRNDNHLTSEKRLQEEEGGKSYLATSLSFQK